MIKFDKVIKKYKKSDRPAVNNLDLNIKKGEICMLVGPSGCGKTTTMKMVNRLIEPTKGKIYIDNKDISEINPINLRLDIGYVIQETGLFPHMTIEENIATVPMEKGWDKDKIDKRVYELLKLVELDPDTYRKKRPGDLSGGQRQRVGVARALAADPPIMLMDEPFGALDPITRGRLQNEFLHIQEKIKKTIVFVTHDIDEAIKMGDKIAVMKEGKIVQFGTPNEILSNPQNDFVQNLIGGNSTLKMMNLIKCEEVMKDILIIDINEKIEVVQKLVEQQDIKHIAVVNKNQNLIGSIELKDLKNNSKQISDIVNEINTTVDLKTPLNDALSEMFSIGRRYIFVTNHKGELKGVVSIDTLLKAVSQGEEISEISA